jgi:hypothetical protein
VSDQINLTSKSENIKNLNDDLQMNVSTDYYAQLNGFNSSSGDATYDWMAAKAEIDHLVQNCKEFPVLLKKSKEISDYWNRVRDQRRKTR